MSAPLPDQGLSIWDGIYDVVNVAGPGLETEVSDLLVVGLAPIRIEKMSKGVDYMVDQLKQRVKKSGKIDLLRIHGHGAPGIQTISCGIDLYASTLPHMRSVLSSYNFDLIRPCLRQLTTSFAPNAEVYLMGCEVGADDAGQELLDNLSELWQVDVIAGIPAQLGGGWCTFNFEGATNAVYN